MSELPTTANVTIPGSPIVHRGNSLTPDPFPLCYEVPASTRGLGYRTTTGYANCEKCRALP